MTTDYFSQISYKFCIYSKNKVSSIQNKQTESHHINRKRRTSFFLVSVSRFKRRIWFKKNIEISDKWIIEYFKVCTLRIIMVLLRFLYLEKVDFQPQTLYAIQRPRQSRMPSPHWPWIVSWQPDSPLSNKSVLFYSLLVWKPSLLIVFVNLIFNYR